MFKTCGLYQTLISDGNPISSMSNDEIADQFNKFDDQKQKAFLTLLFEHFKVTETPESEWKENVYQNGKDVDVRLGKLLDDGTLKNILIRFCEVCRSE